ncbi:sigma-54-dependent transcriptional regulator [Aureliella helgolandensis]|uniref:DNA-binding transcriptional regulator NtrC n=1 Tax=Aureliella helgolandensis TaxID=2527968 RepID=A0A518GFR2_9BACT|nr:sigma-54 dependent transcriptional regulator [Aureliella helgolandensis]QDV27439.1 Transcriptional regulatory protein ZraR [Aureliella helgolandensis]
MTTVLVIDDDRSSRHLIKSGLNGHLGLQVVEAADGDAGLALLEETRPSVVLLDVYLPNHNGLELFRKIKAIDHKVPIIFITGDTSSETAIEAMRSGAFDYLSKPLHIDQLRNLTQSAVRERQLMDEPVALSVGDADSGGERFIGSSKPMIEIYKQIGRVTSQSVTVLIRGASGCGKELVARAIVQHGDRGTAPFIAVNCAAIPDNLLESELFGHEKGAFTGAEKRRLGRFEQCDGGTIFLDEIGDMSPIIQGKVLRLLQEQKFERVGGTELITTNVRIIAATNRPLEQMVEQGEFREDLLYRLNGFTISLPNLTERREDIPLLLEYFLRRAKADMNRPEMVGIAPAALDLLCKYEWPGNIRQLQSVVRQSLLNTTGTVIGPENLPDFIRSSKLVTSPVASESSKGDQVSPPAIDPLRL